MSPYAFRIRVDLPDTMRIESEEETIDLQHSDTGIQLTLSAVGAKKLKNARHLAIKGGVYETSAAAMEAARKCQHAHMLVFTRMRMGADFGDVGTGFSDQRGPRSFVTEHGLKMLEQQRGERMLNDIHGVMVYEYNAEALPRFVRSDVKATLGKPLDEIIRLLQPALKSGSQFSEKELLAFELFGASFFEESVHTRFLTLMMAIEALLEPKRREPIAFRHVKFLIEMTKSCTDLDSAERDSLLGSLQWLLKESISKTGRELVAQRLYQRLYYDMLSTKFFAFCYDLRSHIVHTGRSCSPNTNIGKVVTELERLVSDILCAPYLDLDVE